MDDKEIMIESLQSTIKRMRKAHENDQSALAAYRIETMDLGTKLSALRNTLRGQGKKPVFIIENPELCGGFLFLEAFLEHENQSVPLKNSDHPTRDSVTLPALFRAEKFGISATAPGYDPTGDGSAYQPAAEPAPGSDAAHPPLGYRLEPVGGVRREWYIWWDPSGRWREGTQLHVGDIVYDGSIIANPIPSADGDSHACAECAKLREIAQRETAKAESATGRAVLAERDLAEMRTDLDDTKRLLSESIVERDRLRSREDARKVRLEGFRDGLRERLGDLV